MITPSITAVDKYCLRKFCWVGKIADFGHKKGKGFGKRTAHLHPIFQGLPLPRGVNWRSSLPSALV